MNRGVWISFLGVEETPWTGLLLSKAKVDEFLILHLAISKETIILVLIREENNHQLSIYYMSKTLQQAEACYLNMEKLVISIVTALRELMPYF